MGRVNAGKRTFLTEVCGAEGEVGGVTRFGKNVCFRDLGFYVRCVRQGARICASRPLDVRTSVKKMEESRGNVFAER